MPQMAHVEVPMAIDLLNGHLEGALAVVESAISDGLHVVGFPSRWDGIGVAARRQPRGSDRNGAACGSASEKFHGAHPISPRLRLVANLRAHSDEMESVQVSLPVRFCLIWTIAQFIPRTRNAVAMNRMSVERRRFLRGVPGAAMALLARGTGRAETGMGAHLSVAYEESDLVGFSYESAILAAGKTRRAHPARPAHLASRRGRTGMPYAARA